MKRYLLFVIAFVCVSIGMRAQGYSYQSDGTLGTEKVKVISIDNAGVLSDALAGFNQSQYDYIRIIGPSQSLTLTDGDIAALGNVTTATLDLQMLNASAFTFSNSNVKNVILPDGWTKAEVKAAGQALASTNTTFNAVISYGTNNYGAKLTAYVNNPGTLRTTLLHSGYDQSVNTKLGSGTGDCANLKAIIAMGNICAKDISRAGDYDEDGHYKINGTPDENNVGYNKNTENGNLYTNTNGQDGALVGCYNINMIDLSDAYVPDEYATDIVIGYNGITDTDVKEVWIPTDPRFKTIPADFLNINSNFIHQICIPGNIETIKTRAFAGSGTNIDYIWTTGPDGNTRYDNGAYFVSGDETIHKYKDNPDPTDPENVDWADGDDNNFTYGTITLPPNLKLIERHAFASSIHVRDLYVLTETAPECHVDAFNSVMYHANNTLNNSSIKEEDGAKIITRDAYTMSGYQMMTMLHYPRTTKTHNSQRYTDPSREYNIATGERDGNGNMLYFPTHTEFATAHDQGTYGYTWNGWKIERTWYNNEITLGTEGGYYGSISGSSGHDTANGQLLANQFYINNDLTDVDKTTCSFYDVTLGDDNMPNGYQKPAGLKDYWTNYRNGNQLYPQAKYETSNYVYVRDDNGDYVKDPSNNSNTIFRDYAGSADDQLERYSREQVPVKDGQGNIIYDGCEDGKYVKDYEWARDDAEGDFVKENVQSGYSATQTLVDGVNTYYSDATGSTAVTPQVGEGMYVECGTDDDYSPINTNNPIDSYDAFYNSSGTPTNLPFNKTLYVPNGTQTKYTPTNKLKYGVTHYYDANGQEVVPALTPSNPATGLIYYKDENNIEHETTVFVPGQGNYYIKTYDQWNGYTLIGDVSDSYPVVNLDGTYYYKDGEEYKYKAEELGYYVSGTTYYSYDSGNNTYSEYTVSWNDITNAYNGVYYYVSGSHPAYCSAEDEEYDANETYYSDQNGTVATTITLNDNYYIPTYVDVYREKTNDDVAPFYKKNYLDTYHLATEADAGETDRYCIRTEDYQASTPIEYSISHDYRGWHQFVLAGVAHNSKIPFEPIRSFITDNDWWTICEPYDLRYSDMKKFFGTDRWGFGAKIPYLSKLMYVIRDVENQTITLMFSKNLMEYKEQRLAKDTQVGFETGNRVHGYIDEDIKWTAEELAEDPIILHAGVPYMIRPNLTVDATTGKIDGVRQFDIMKNEPGDLYDRLHEALTLSAGKQFDLIYNGEYTVPAYVVGTSTTVTEGTTNTKEITMKDGTKFTYTSEGKTIKYHGKDVPYSISTDFTYTFVGTFYKSAMPQYCYFLGWDSKKNQAAFWYSRTLDKDGWNWNNQTGIICPNFNTNLTIHQATSFDDPARWQFNPSNKEDKVEDFVECDDFKVGTAASNAKQYTMGYGASMNLVPVDEDPLAEDFGDQNVLSIDEIQSLDVKGEWYNVNGQKLSGRPTQSGVYIMGNKKYVVK